MGRKQSTFSFLLSDPFTGLGLDRGPRCSFTLFSRIRSSPFFPPAGLLLEVGKCPFSFAKKEERAANSLSLNLTYTYELPTSRTRTGTGLKLKGTSLSSSFPQGKRS